MPELAHDLGHTHADAMYSLLLGADALGALLAAVALETTGLLRLTPRTACVLAMIWCGALAGFAMATAYPLAVALLLVAGFVELSFNSMAQTLVQLNAPAQLRGRVIGVFMMSSLGMRTFSGLTVGVTGALIGVHYSLALSAAVLLVLIIFLFLAQTRIAARTQ
jgi:MFS family permease